MTLQIRLGVATVGIAALVLPAALLWHSSRGAAQSNPPTNQYAAPHVVQPTERVPPTRQQPPAPQPPDAAAPPARPTVTPDLNVTGPTAESSSSLLRVPVSHNLPGNVNIQPKIENPVGDNPAAIERGMQYFISFNCVGCHAPNGTGGMGPSLSNQKWIYGSDPANIYLTIVQGRPAGMPAWGSMLPDSVVWDLVAYIHSISHPDTPQFGKTTSLHPLSPSIEQVPAQEIKTSHPWDHTERFSMGRKPGPEGGRAKSEIQAPNAPGAD